MFTNITYFIVIKDKVLIMIHKICDLNIIILLIWLYLYIVFIIRVNK